MLPHKTRGTFLVAFLCAGIGPACTKQSGDFALSDSGIAELHKMPTVGAEPSEEPDSGIRVPVEGLEAIVAASSAVLLGTARSIQLDAFVQQQTMGDLVWFIHYDTVVLDVERYVGPLRNGSNEIALLPSKCEAFQSSRPVDRALSICSGRGPSNTPAVGERLVGFIRGDTGRLLLVHKASVVNGNVDISSVEPTGASSPLDVIWTRVASTWGELGR